ncbi:hypothetical protein C0J52_08069 [Blattella germanica]|nr:hypothetical protein C0J52_08069 [Blattella germanica]
MAIGFVYFRSFIHINIAIIYCIISIIMSFETVHLLVSNTTLLKDIRTKYGNFSLKLQVTFALNAINGMCVYGTTKKNLVSPSIKGVMKRKDKHKYCTYVYHIHHVLHSVNYNMFDDG